MITNCDLVTLFASSLSVLNVIRPDQEICAHLEVSLASSLPSPVVGATGTMTSSMNTLLPLSTPLELQVSLHKAYYEFLAVTWSHTKCPDIPESPSAAEVTLSFKIKMKWET